MNIKSSYQYQMADNKKGLIIYYSIIVVVFAALYIATSIINTKYPGVVGQVGGADMASLIFIFIAGLSGFKEAFGMLVQNSVSRKTMFTGRILTTLSIGLIMAVVDTVIFIIIKTLTERDGGIFRYSSMFQQIYPGATANMSVNGTLYITGFIFAFFLYISFMSLGFLITVLFYRLNKGGKVAVGISVPAVFMIVIPIIDAVITEGEISYYISKVIDLSYGISSQQPYKGMITGFILFIICSIFSWLLMRKAVVRN